MRRAANTATVVESGSALVRWGWSVPSGGADAALPDAPQRPRALFGENLGGIVQGMPSNNERSNEGPSNEERSGEERSGEGQRPTRSAAQTDLVVEIAIKQSALVLANWDLAKDLSSTLLPKARHAVLGIAEDPASRGVDQAACPVLDVSLPACPITGSLTALLLNYRSMRKPADRQSCGGLGRGLEPSHVNGKVWGGPAPNIMDESHRGPVGIL